MKYDIIKDFHSACDMRKAAIAAITRRLGRWSRGRWLDHTDLFAEILERFRREFIQDYALETNCLENWECGLGQIVDLQDDNICSLLPYLLTAYIYNFADKNGSFVHNFLKMVKKESLIKILTGVPVEKKIYQVN